MNTTLSFEKAHDLLSANNQTHILRFWPRLSQEQRTSLLSQIETIDFHELARMRAMLAPAQHTTTTPDEIVPARVLLRTDIDLPSAAAAGASQLANNRVAVVLVAGGQGSRLGFDGPKGCFPLAPLSHASLFAIHARKILALEQRHACQIPFYIMTSHANDAATRAFFQTRSHFGLDPRRVNFFTQGMWPALWPDGRIVMDQMAHLFMSPDGHGGTLSALQTSGMLDDMQARGIQTVFYFQVDNPLVEIADPVFVGLHTTQQADMSLKVCAKRAPDEGLGAVVVRNGRNAVVEYTELTDQQKNRRDQNGKLHFLFGSVAIHLFDLNFLIREATTDMPLHVAHKKVPYCDDSGKECKPDSPNAFKFEKFIFDIVPHANNVLNFEFAREEEFAPVKNADGMDSPATARQAMSDKFARFLTSRGVTVPTHPDGSSRFALEIDPCFACEPAQLKAVFPLGLTVNGDLLLA